MDVDGTGEPDVIPLQTLGAIDLDKTNMSGNDLALWALCNASSSEEGGYANRHSRDPVNMFGRERGTEGERVATRRNPLAAAYPCLFPYGVGGIESDQEDPVSFAEHVKWALKYYDRRFRTHHSFPFVVFGIQQRREIMRSARLQMNKRQFVKHARTFASITAQDVKNAVKEMELKQSITDPRIRLLNKLVFGTGTQVMGSNESRTTCRHDVWATNVFMRQVNIWFTVVRRGYG